MEKKTVPTGSFLFLLFCFCLIQTNYAGEISVRSVDPSTPSLIGRQVDDRRIQLVQRNLLVILPKNSSLQTYKTYLSDLRASGYNLNIYFSNSMKKSEYDNVAGLKYGGIIFIDRGANIRWLLDRLVNSIHKGTNVVVITEGKTLGVITNRVAQSCGIEFETSETFVADFLRPHDDTYLEIAYTAEAPLTSTSGLLAYRGFSQFVNIENSFIFSILRPENSHYLRSVNGDARSLGVQSALVSAMNARNGARMVFSGSAEMFSDAFFTAKTINRIWVAEITDWCFQQRGVLAYSNLKHYKVGEDVAASMYRMKDEVNFSIDFHELKNGYWEPYYADDIQLELVMLNPHMRLFLDPPKSQLSPTFFKRVKTPDVFGIFKFVVKYNRFGYNPIYIESLAPLRNYKHDDYDRFIFSAYPFYASAIFCLLGATIFSILFLFSAEKKIATKQN